MQTTNAPFAYPSSHSPGVSPGQTATSHQVGRKNSPASIGMGENNLQPVDAAGCKWVQARIQRSTSAIPQASDRGISPQSKGHLRGDTEIDRERSNTGSKRRGGVLFQAVSSSQEGRTDAAGDQPSALEPISVSQSFQDGGYACSERSPTEERLDDKNRSQGCIFLDSNPPTAQEVSTVQMGKKIVSVYVSPLRTGLGAESVHKDPSSSGGFPSQQRHSLRHLPGRHSPSGSGQVKADGTHSDDIIATRSLGFSSELPQVSPGTYTGADLPRLHNRFSKEGAEPPTREDGSNSQGGQSYPGSSTDFCSFTGPANWEDVGSSSGNSACPSPLPEFTEAQACGIEEEGLRRIIPSGSQRLGMVDTQSVRVERPSNSDTRSNSCDRDRCLEKRMGGILSRNNDGRMLEQPGGGAPYKCPRDDGSVFCYQSLRQGLPSDLNLAAHRQHFSGGPCQQNGRHEIPTANVTGEGSVGVVSSKEDYSHSSAPARLGECDGRLPFQALNRPNGLDAGPQYISMPRQDLGTNAGRSVCHTVYHTASSFLQLEAGPRGGGYRCTGTELVQYQGICTPPMVPDFTCIAEGSVRQGNSGANYPFVAHPSMVPNIAGTTSGLPNPAASRTARNNSFPQLCGPNAGDSTTTGRLEGLRQRFRAEKISDRAIDLIFCSWREKTNSNYNSAWKSWEGWCATRCICPFSTDIPNVLEFLTEKFEAGLKYRSLNCYRSALSSALIPVDGFQVGQHPLVIRLMKGVFNSRPPEPRYSQTWDVNLVLEYIKSLGPNEDLSLKLLSRKLATLLALVLAHRSSDLSRLSLHGRKYSADGVMLRSTGLAKQARPGKEKSLQPVFIAHYFKDKSLCPVACLGAYEKATASFRKENQQLFLAVISPHNPVTSSTIARWLKQAITASGISSEFTAHSTRGASSTAAAMNGITIREVMERAGWSSKNTFCKHYFRPSEQATLAAEFGASVLKQSTNMQRTC